MCFFDFYKAKQKIENIVFTDYEKDISSCFPKFPKHLENREELSVLPKFWANIFYFLSHWDSLVL